MPLCRVRQITEVIGQRKISDLKVRAGMVEWHAKHTASVSAQSEKAGKHIQTWSLLGDPERDSLPEIGDMTEEELARMIEGEQSDDRAAADPRNEMAFAWLESTLGSAQ